MDEVAELRAQAKRATEIADDLRYDIQPIARAYMGDLAATVHALLDALAVKDAEVRNELMLSFDILLSAVALIPEHGMREGPTSRGWLACIEELQTRLHGDPPMRVDDLLTLYGEGGELRGREQLPPLPPAERLAAENAALREAWAKADLQHSDHCRYYPDSDESRCSCGLTALERAFATAAEPAPGARTWRAAGHAGGAR